MLNTKNLRDVFFLLTIGALFFGFIYVLAPFLGVIFVALILVELFYPWYKYLLKNSKSEKAASLLAGLSVILTVVVPFVFILIVVFLQANSLLDKVSSFWQTHDVVSTYKNTLQDVNNLIARFSTNPENQISNSEVKNFVVNTSKDFISIFVNAISSSVAGAFGFITQITMFLIALFTFFPLRDRIYETMTRLSPLEDRLDDMFISKFAQTAKSIIKGTLLVAIFMGVMGGIMLLILGIPAAAFFGLLMTVFSIIPIGSGIVWIPISIYLIATGEIAKGIILFAFGLIMTSGVDTMLRSKLTKKEAAVHPLLLAFAILGGIKAFGVLGFIYGPLIVVFFVSIMEVYKEKYKDE
jgi:predicted PurR-regulated permease PerM